VRCAIGTTDVTAASTTTAVDNNGNDEKDARKANDHGGPSKHER